jgi:hypothetical protein
VLPDPPVIRLLIVHQVLTFMRVRDESIMGQRAGFMSAHSSTSCTLPLRFRFLESRS